MTPNSGRVLTGHFYGHLGRDEREAFLSEASRIAGELVMVDAALRPELVPELWEERLLNDGSRHRIYKRYFAAEQLADEIDGEILMAGEWFVAARASLPGSLRGRFDHARRAHPGDPAVVKQG